MENLFLFQLGWKERLVDVGNLLRSLPQTRCLFNFGCQKPWKIHSILYDHASDCASLFLLHFG